MSARPPDAPQAAKWAELFQDGRALMSGVLCLGVWLNAVDALVTATVMPSVARDLGGYAYFSWATAGFMLGSILAGAGAGLLAERMGLRRALAGSGVVYAIGCAASALAGSIWPFLLGRLIQGAGAGFVVGLCYVAVRATFDERLWSNVFASLSGVWGAATLLGPLVGGLFAGARLWRGVFWLFALQAVLFAAATRVLPQGERSVELRRVGLPWCQLGVLAGGVLLIAGAGVLHLRAAAAIMAVAGIGLLGLTLRLDARASCRLLPSAAGDLSRPAGQGYLTILSLSAAATGFSVYGAALLQARLGLTPLQAGYVVASESVGWTVTALTVASAPPRRRGGLIRAGALAVVIGLGGCAYTLSSRPVLCVFACGAVMGGGFGLCWSFVAQRILNSLPQAEGAIGSAAIPMMQILGNAVGSAGAGLIANLLGFADGVSPSGASRASPILLGAFVPVAIIGLAAAWRLGAAEAGRPARPSWRW